VGRLEYLWLVVGWRSITAMSDSIFLVGDDGSLVEMTSAAYDAEAELQKLLADNIHLLPGAQIDQDCPRRWLLIRREAGVPDREGGGAWWAVDHLAVDQDAVPTFVEVKRAVDTRARREVVAQMLDYAANGSVFWTPGQLRAWFEGDDRPAAMERVLDLLGQPDGDPDVVADEFWQAVGTNLREGRIRLVFVADEIPASLQRLVEFLNEQMPRVEVLALEIRQYRAKGGKAGALVPRLVGQTARAQAVKEPAATTAARRPAQWTAAEVLDALGPPGQEPAVTGAAVHTWAAAHSWIEITGGSGLTDRSFTMAADTGRDTSPYAGVLGLYTTPRNGRPFLEIRIRQMLAIPPYDDSPARDRLTADLQALGIPRLQAPGALTGKRPNIPLDELADGRITGLLTVIDQWIETVRVHRADPEYGLSAPPQPGNLR